MNLPKNRFTCLHTHTDFCDGKGDVESYCQSAWDKGLHSLGFSSHAPTGKKTGISDSSWNKMGDRLQEYAQTVNAAKRRWEGRLPVFLGLEVDFIPGLMSPMDRDYQNLGLDYIIGSVHYVIPPHGAPFTVDSSLIKVEKGIKEGFGGDPLAMVEAYYDSLEMLIKSGGFDFLGHPDLVKKHNLENRFFDEDSQYYRKRCQTAAGLAGKYGIAIEVNTGGMNRRYLDSPYPSLQLLEMFCKNNVPALISADAHNREDLDGHYKEAAETLLAAGYTEMLLFEGRKNNSPVWVREKL